MTAAGWHRDVGAADVLQFGQQNSAVSDGPGGELLRPGREQFGYPLVGQLRE